jgi:uncharacterized protein
MPQHLLIVPSQSCPAKCAYCFGPHQGHSHMRQDTIASIASWQQNQAEDGPLEIIFHGGEPLVPGAGFYREALPALLQGISNRKIHFSMQSNVWLLDEELCSLFREYRVALGTSLDGPEEINDGQRGKGYFRRTMASINLARDYGLDVGCICTFTAQSAPRAREIFDFFKVEGLNFTVHAAVPSLRYRHSDRWALSVPEYGELMVSLFDRYLDHLSSIRINTFDILCQSISKQSGGICTFNDCLGHYLSVGPDGAVYPCQRFAGIRKFSLGNVHDFHERSDLAQAPAWQRLADRQIHVDSECSDCPYTRICRGGCSYNWLAGQSVQLTSSRRDPYCPAYRRIFSHITDRAAAEFFGEENIQNVIDIGGQQLLHKGKVLSLMTGKPHPYEMAYNARHLLAAVILAETGSSSEAASRFQRLGLTTDARRTGKMMQRMFADLNVPSAKLGNLYLHVTLDCPLRCTHCYANAGSGQTSSFPIADLIKACHEAAELGFRHAVITGGEPLIHPDRDIMLDALSALRKAVKPLLTVLRTSLVLPADDALLHKISECADQVVVSIDGDEETHDARRGKGSYARTLANLERLAALRGPSELSLATVLPLRLLQGQPGDSVRALAKRLGIRRTRFRPILPIGRALESQPDATPDTLWGYLDPSDIVAYGFNPVMSCGIGHNLYVEPDGAAYPCYAWHSPASKIGRINSPPGLAGVIRTPAFQKLRRHNVNTNLRCSKCNLRYLCGGACRAWNRQRPQEQNDLDAPPPDCGPLFQRARQLFEQALEQLDISVRDWENAGCILLAHPPE